MFLIVKTIKHCLKIVFVMKCKYLTTYKAYLTQQLTTYKAHLTTVPLPHQVIRNALDCFVQNRTDQKLVKVKVELEERGLSDGEASPVAICNIFMMI